MLLQCLQPLSGCPGIWRKIHPPYTALQAPRPLPTSPGSPYPALLPFQAPCTLSSRPVPAPALALLQLFEHLAPPNPLDLSLNILSSESFPDHLSEKGLPFSFSSQHCLFPLQPRSVSFFAPLPNYCLYPKPGCKVHENKDLAYLTPHRITAPHIESAT